MNPFPTTENHSSTAKKPENRAQKTGGGGELELVNFAIHGSYKVVKKQIVFDPEGNPLPKLKMTGRQFWTPQAKRYVAWKILVVNSFVKSLEIAHPDIYKKALWRVTQGLKPIPGFKGKAHMSVDAYYRNHKHPDTENVFGSVADALFENDNNLAGIFDFEVGGDKTSMVIANIHLPKNIWS